MIVPAPIDLTWFRRQVGERRYLALAHECNISPALMHALVGATIDQERGGGAVLLQALILTSLSRSPS